MRIALLAHCRHPIRQPYAGGLEMHTAMVADGLVARGHDVTLFAKGRSRTTARLVPIIDGGLQFGVSAEPSERLQSIMDGAIRRAISRIGDGDYDVTFNNSLEALPYVAMPDLPVFTMLHTPATLSPVNEIVDRPGWRRGEHHVFAGVSDTTSRDWSARIGPVVRIPNGIDRGHWSPRSLVRTRHGLAVWAARITPEKGLPLAIEAAELAGLKLAIYGPIPDPGYFDTMIAPRLNDRVRYLGHLHHRALPAAVQRGAVFLATPQWDEPFGLAMVEAMAVGTPVAATPRGAAAEIVSPAGGVLALDDTPGAVAAAALQAMTLDREGVRRSVRRFDRELMLDAYETILADLAAAAAGATPAVERPGRPTSHLDDEMSDP